MITRGYVAQQAQHFGTSRRVADEQSLGTNQNDQSDCFSNFPYTNSARGYAKSFRLTMEMVNIHTCRYVKWSREEAKET